VAPFPRTPAGDQGGRLVAAGSAASSRAGGTRGCRGYRCLVDEDGARREDSAARAPYASDKAFGRGGLLAGACLFGLPGAFLFLTLSMWFAYGVEIWGPAIYMMALASGGLLAVRGFSRERVAAHGAAFIVITILAVVAAYLLPL
jgi:hypothetical protein